MRIDQLFDVTYGNKFDFNKMSPQIGGVAFVGRSGVRQGISGYVTPLSDVVPFPAGLITVALGGASRLATFVQREPFYTAQNVAVLRGKQEMSLQAKLYWAMCIKANRFRYEGFGREANRTLSLLELPDSVPDWALTAPVPTLDEVTSPIGSVLALESPEGWREFTFDELFDVQKGRRLTKADRSPGTTRFVGASERNNGVTDLVSAAAEFEAGLLTVPYNGSVGFAFYQDEPFLASDDVNVLVPREAVSKGALLFVATIIRHSKVRFSYGYKWNQERMKASSLRLPQTPEGRPDWEYMDAYMRGLPFSSGALGSFSDGASDHNLEPRSPSSA